MFELRTSNFEVDNNIKLKPITEIIRMKMIGPS